MEGQAEKPQANHSGMRNSISRQALSTNRYPIHHGKTIDFSNGIRFVAHPPFEWLMQLRFRKNGYKKKTE